MNSAELIRRSQALYDELGIERLRQRGVSRDHDRHYGMIVYPSIKSSEPMGYQQVFGEQRKGSARLYVHIPFCSGRCTFCHFQLAPTSVTDAYMERLRREIQLLGEQRGEVQFHGSFIGGGTPSLLPTAHLERLLHEVFGRLGASREGFNTIEIHPEIVREPDVRDRLVLLKELGINRVSIGVQAFEQVVLDNLHRRHTVEENYEILRLVKEIGFDYIDLDIMYGLPGQTCEHWAHTLEEVPRLDVDSVSIFYLIRKPSVPLSKNENWSSIPLPAARDSTLMHLMARESLQAAGMVETLTDHFHRPYPQRSTEKFESNLIYSDFFVIPVGISGWGYMNSHHYWNAFDREEYFRLIDGGSLSVSRAVELSEEERLRRDILFCLKYGEVPFAAFQDKYAVDLRQQFRYVFEVVSELGLVEVGEEAAVLTDAGRIYMEETAAFFFSNRVARDQWAPARGGDGTDLETFNYLVTPERPAAQNVLAVIAHPNPDSLTHALCGQFTAGAAAAGHSIERLDLCQQDYQSHLAAAEIGATEPAEDVRLHMEMIDRADVLAFFFPIWWYSSPAILRGWFDRTLMLGYAFEFDLQQRYRGLLGAKSAVTICTAGDTRDSFETRWGEPFVANQIDSLFEFVGIERRLVRVFCDVHHLQPPELQELLDEASFLGRNLAVTLESSPALSVR